MLRFHLQFLVVANMVVARQSGMQDQTYERKRQWFALGDAEAAALVWEGEVEQKLYWHDRDAGRAVRLQTLGADWRKVACQ